MNNWPMLSGFSFKSTSNVLISLRQLVIRIAFALVITSCLSPIEIDTVKRGGVLTVEGQVSTIIDQNYVRLGITAETEQLPNPLSGALVTLYDEVGNDSVFRENPFVPGLYSTQFQAVPGRKYWIMIVTPDGETYESSPEIMPALPGQLSTTFEIVYEEYVDFEGAILTDPFVKIYCNATLPSSEEPAYFKWSIREDFILSPTDFPDPFGNIPPPCYIAQNADPQTITLVNGENLGSTTIENLLIGSRVADFSFHEKHYFTTYQSSITREAYEYWRKVDILANQTGSIFDTPPAEIKGNIVNVNDPAEKVYGFFQAANQTLDRFVLYPENFPFPLLSERCTYEWWKAEYPTRCLDCLSVRNSSYDRPEWF